MMFLSGLTPHGRRMLFGLIGTLVVIAVIISGIAYLTKQEAKENENFVNTGVIIERKENSDAVLNRVEVAAEPVTDDERNSVCSRYDRACQSNQ